MSCRQDSIIIVNVWRLQSRESAKVNKFLYLHNDSTTLNKEHQKMVESWHHCYKRVAKYIQYIVQAYIFKNHNYTLMTDS
ncbi:uncharacterized protein OCT59_024693 [Rhizophagus irregularis]|uniref:Uncharacterized protein n=1 Tax=Rhizophagus irregularis TaxID=588596 RepID=A0A915ZBX2_9GLOM|nr:hypothetical protein OCT59_024693 [Rhizophagus irregularis]GBC19392.1 hypothetical protein RIR_jg41652.t1 [Rhizophagus irregularis DAOM 181602=DAOM 197198]CAB4392695.1 unnamed protein product [Rhizophagus irregularis]CAB4488971.1 unnamed protein product [Rhizophagus irregularis]CAB5115448.1 unnamed protein product [Rhizophagus irregularis]